MAEPSASKIEPAVATPLASYDASHDVAALQDATDAAAREDGEALPDPAAALARARLRVANWTAILARFKRDLDPDFDPDHPPPLTVEPPEVGGVQYPPGVRPSDIKDPKARREYETAIANNSERVQRFSAAVKLREAHEAILERAAESLRDAHETLALPVAELAAALDKADILPADRTTLRGAIAR